MPKSLKFKSLHVDTVKDQKDMLLKKRKDLNAPTAEPLVLFIQKMKLIKNLMKKEQLKFSTGIQKILKKTLFFLQKTLLDTTKVC